jgi:hypothetical protein
VAEQELDPEQLLEGIRQLKVSDVLLSAFSTVAQLGYAKLEPAARDLDQARLAIEALRALMPVLEEAVEESTLRDFRQVVSNLQLSYADAAAAKPADEGAPEQAAAKEEEEPAGDG